MGLCLYFTRPLNAHDRMAIQRSQCKQLFFVAKKNLTHVFNCLIWGKDFWITGKYVSGMYSDAIYITQFRSYLMERIWENSSEFWIKYNLQWTEYRTSLLFRSHLTLDWLRELCRWPHLQQLGWPFLHQVHWPQQSGWCHLLRLPQAYWLPNSKLWGSVLKLRLRMSRCSRVEYTSLNLEIIINRLTW